jgi:hypothetical protein
MTFDHGCCGRYHVLTWHVQSIAKTVDTNSNIHSQKSVLYRLIYKTSNNLDVTKHNCGKNEHSRFKQTSIQDSNGCLFFPIWKCMSRPTPYYCFISLCDNTNNFVFCVRARTHAHTHTTVQSFIQEMKEILENCSYITWEWVHLGI